MFLELLVIIVGLILIADRSQKAKYYLKHFVYYGGVMAAAFLWIPYFATRPKNVLNLL